MPDISNPNITIENNNQYNPNIGVIAPYKYYCVYDKNKRLIAKLRDPEEAARYKSSGLGEYDVVEEDA